MCKHECGSGDNFQWWALFGSLSLNSGHQAGSKHIYLASNVFLLYPRPHVSNRVFQCVKVRIE